MKQNKETLKQFFETGDKPTQQQYADLIDSYIDAKQPEGEANRRFVIDESGEVSVASEQQVPEYTLSPLSEINTIGLLKDGVSVSQIDLTPYLDDTNLARLVSGSVDANGIATFTRDDDTTFTIDLSNLKGADTIDLQAGENITIDKTNPLTPVVSAAITVEESDVNLVNDYENLVREEIKIERVNFNRQYGLVFFENDYVIEDHEFPVKIKVVGSSNKIGYLTITSKDVGNYYVVSTFDFTDEQGNILPYDPKLPYNFFLTAYRINSNVVTTQKDFNKVINSKIEECPTSERYVGLSNDYENLVKEEESQFSDILFYENSNQIEFIYDYYLEDYEFPVKIKVVGSSNKIGYLTIVGRDPENYYYIVSSTYFTDEQGNILPYDPDLPYNTILTTYKINLPLPITQEDFNKAISSRIKDYQAGTNITIDNTDPKKPVINSTVASVNSINIRISDSQLNFDGTENSYIELIPAQPDKIILVKSILVQNYIDTPETNNNSEFYIGYNLDASGYSLNLLNIDFTYSNILTGPFAINVAGGNLDELPIGSPVVFRGAEYTAYSGITGNVNIYIEYVYVDSIASTNLP